MTERGKVKWLLIVAVSEYAGDKGRATSRGIMGRLPSVSLDASRLSEVLHRYSDTSFGRTIPLYNEQATRGAIFTALEEIAKHALECDQVIIYFGGHGHQKPGGDSPMPDGMTRYLLPYEATWNDAEMWGISTKQLAEALKSLNHVSEIVLIVDCCHSGSFTGVFWESLASLELRGHSRHVCAAARSTQQAGEIDEVGSFFLPAFCDAIEGKAGLPLDGHISVQMAYGSAERQLDRLSRQMRHLQEATMIHAGREIYLTYVEPSIGPPVKPICEAEKEPSRAFLIALVHELEVQPSAGGRRLSLRVDDTDQAIFSSEGKRWLFERHLGCPDRIRKLEKTFGQEAEFHHDDEDLPLRWASGGCLPILSYRDREFFILNFRDIYPQGWNIANGGSDTFVEMIHLTNLIEREFKEELLVYHPKRNTIYYFEIPNSVVDPLPFQDRALQLWHLDRCRREPLECILEPGPDSVRVEAYKGGGLWTSAVTTGVYLSFNAYELGIECIKVAKVQIPETLALEDLLFLNGEISSRTGQLIDEAVGLLDVHKYLDWLEAGQKSDLPFDFLYQGRRRLSGMADSARIKALWMYRNAFCDVTWKTITRYLESVS